MENINLIQSGLFYYYDAIILNLPIRISLIINNLSLVFLKFVNGNNGAVYERLYNLTGENDEDISYNFNINAPNNNQLKKYLLIFEELLELIKNLFNLTIIN